jgi:outer membrane protein TolC
MNGLENMTFGRAATVWWITATVGALVLHADPAPSSVPGPGPAPPAEPISVRDVPGTVLTWEDCVRLTTANSPALQSSREAVLNSDAVRMGAYSALYPQISANFTDTRTYTGAGLYAPRNYSTSYLEQLSVSQMIFNGFATKGNIDHLCAEIDHVEPKRYRYPAKGGAAGAVAV